MEYHSSNKEFLLAQVKQIESEINSLDNSAVLRWIEEHAENLRLNNKMEDAHES